MLTVKGTLLLLSFLVPPTHCLHRAGMQHGIGRKYWPNGTKYKVRFLVFPLSIFGDDTNQATDDDDDVVDDTTPRTTTAS